MTFKPFPKIANIKDMQITVTQKIHGSNAQVFIEEVKDEEFFPDPLVHSLRQMTTAELPNTDGNGMVVSDGKLYSLKTGSRTRWITPLDDNYGFAAFVYANKQEFVEKLGVGQHFGEWAGPGINSGEGLSQKTFVLFDWWSFPPERPLPLQTCVVPVLLQAKGDADLESIMDDLKANGSKLAPGFMRPEGIVVSIAGARYKKVFEAEETQWRGGEKEKKECVAKAERINIDHVLQPIRLEKLLARDERYIKEYPASLASLCSDYTTDLIEEKQITGTEDEIKAVRKALGSKLFGFIKSEMTKVKS